jgi:hypothetical protein
MRDVLDYVRAEERPERRAKRIEERLVVVGPQMPRESYAEALGYNARLMQALREEGVWPPPYAA